MTTDINKFLKKCNADYLFFCLASPSTDLTVLPELGDRREGKATHANWELLNFLLEVAGNCKKITLEYIYQSKWYFKSPRI